MIDLDWATDTEDPPSFEDLRREVRHRGFHEPATVRVVSEMLLHIVTMLFGLYLFVLADVFWIELVACVISTMGLLGISTNTHTCSHRAATSSRAVDDLLTLIGYPFFLMVSASYWKHKHIVVHHPAPNVIGTDKDIDLKPFFALTIEDYDQASDNKKRWYRIQWLFFPLALSVNGFGVQLTGWRFLLGQLANKHTRRLYHWLDLATMIVHLLVWVFVPMLFFHPLDVLGLYVLRIALMGYAMFIAFAPAHYPVDACCSDKLDHAQHFALLQCTNTINFDTGWLGRLLCSGVDFQIEHHLFPHVSHAHYPRLAPLVRGFCQANGYPYRSLPWYLAIWKSLTVLYHRKEIFDSKEGLIAASSTTIKRGYT